MSLRVACERLTITGKQALFMPVSFVTGGLSARYPFSLRSGTDELKRAKGYMCDQTIDSR